MLVVELTLLWKSDSHEFKDSLVTLCHCNQCLILEFGSGHFSPLNLFNQRGALLGDEVRSSGSQIEGLGGRGLVNAKNDGSLKTKWAYAELAPVNFL